MIKKIIIASAIIGGVIIGCGPDSGSSGPSENAVLENEGETGILGQVEPIPPKMRLRYGQDGTLGLYCDNPNAATVYDSGDFNTSDTAVAATKRAISSQGPDDIDRQNGTGRNTLVRFEMTTDMKTADGNVTEGVKVHPLLAVFEQQIVGGYEMGDGSADIGDPNQVHALYASYSLDNGDTWKKYLLSNTTDRSSIDVQWDGSKIAYPGHVQKPTVAIYSNRIMVAWNDKYCPSGNPLDLEKVEDPDPTDQNVTGTTYPTDYFAVNGSQGYIDYGGIVAPNDKIVYQVPFSCVWTARGMINPEDGNITWHAPMQLTTGTRDSNHIRVAAHWAGFALSWQEDTTGLRSGKGEGPGDGWSGATTNHGTDIWYSSLKWDDFTATVEDVNVTDTNETSKVKSAVNFHYPVRITDNEKCSNDDTKPYCQYLCDTYGYEEFNTTKNNKDMTLTRCKTSYIDALENTQVVLNGDTGASRSAMTILETSERQYVVVFGYEETKGLKENNESSGDMDQGTVDTDIELEGKSVYFESWLFDALDDFNVSDPSTIQNVAMPLVSSGNIVNVKAPEQNDTSNMIFENARRLIIGTQIDACNADQFHFSFMYKQSFETRGDSSDMFIRMNKGFTYEDFVSLNDRNVTNISAQNPQPDVNSTNYVVDWTESNLDAQTYENMDENTFSPRIYLRGNDIFTGYAYTPSAVKTGQGHMPSNFHSNIYIDGQWRGPVNVTQVTKATETTEDPRYVPTKRGRYEFSGLESDKSNPDTVFIVWGNVTLTEDGTDHAPADIFYTRSTDKGLTWDPTKKLAAREGATIEEKEVQAVASPDGKTVFNVWIQEEEEFDKTDRFSGTDTWFGRMDYNATDTNVSE
ncbi:hypothetical protein KJ877_02985 [bacterium]|nr:hypothetical protein [bacterium]MBU1990171.1 hypothetical protein [bacterium]